MGTKNYITQATRIPQTLNERLEAIRHTRGTTKKALSRACARAPAYWSKMLAERYIPSREVVGAFCLFYHLDAALTKSLLDQQALSSRCQNYPTLHPSDPYTFSCSFCPAAHTSVFRPEGWRFKAYRLYCPAEACVRKAYATYKAEWQQRTRTQHACERAAGVRAPRKKRVERDEGPWTARDWGYGITHVRERAIALEQINEPYLPAMPQRMWVVRHGG